MGQASLELQHGTRDLVSEGSMTLVMVDGSGVVSSCGSGAAETGHKGRTRSAGSSGGGSSVVMHFDGCIWFGFWVMGCSRTDVLNETGKGAF